MKLLFLTDNFPPEVNAPAMRTYEHCKEWVKSGVDVTVITCAPNFPHGKVYQGFTNKLYQRELIDGIKVIRVWTYITVNEGFLKRILDYISFCFSAFWAALFVKCDLIVATSPQFFTALCGYFVSLAKSRPWVFELRDLWPDTIRSVSAIRSSAVLQALERLELFLYRKADLIVALTDAFKANLVSRGIDPGKIAVVTNGASLDMFGPRPKDPELVEQLGLANKFVVGYIGTHGLTHNLQKIVGSLDQVADETIIFLFLGNGASKREMRKIAEQKRLRNTLFLDSVPKHEVARFWSIIDVALIPLKKDPTFTTVIPSKIFEAAAMKKPILLGVAGQAQEIIEKYEAGICFEPDNIDEMIAKLAELKADPNRYTTLAENGYRLAKDFDRKTLARQMLNILKTLCE